MSKKKPTPAKPKAKRSKPKRLTLDAAKHNLIEFTTVDSSRYALDCLCYVPELKALVATDGAVMAVAEVDGVSGDVERFMLSAMAFSDFVKWRKRGSRVVVEVGGKQIVSRMDKEVVACDRGQEDLKFPNVLAVLDDAPQGGAPIIFDARRLKAICDHALAVHPQAALKWRFAQGANPSHCDVVVDLGGPQREPVGVSYVLMPIVQQQLITMQTAIERIRIVCQRHHNPSVVTSTHILANKVLAIIEEMENSGD